MKTKTRFGPLTPCGEVQRLSRRFWVSLAAFLGAFSLLWSVQSGEKQDDEILERKKVVLRSGKESGWAEFTYQQNRLVLTVYNRQGKRRGQWTWPSTEPAGGGAAAKWTGARSTNDIRLETPARRETPGRRASQRGPKLSQAAALFREQCASCHDNDGRGAAERTSMPRLPDFTNRRWQSRRSDAQLLSSILRGRGAEMPPFDDEVTLTQARSLVSVVRRFGGFEGRTISQDPASEGDFATRLRALQTQWEQLRRQMRQPSNPDNQ